MHSSANDDPGAHVCLIVNADDYGSFDCVSKGILEAAARGIVTATGVIANAARFSDNIARLKKQPGLDVGVHLNLTDGIPLTNDVRRRLARWSGRFPGKFAVAMAVASGAIPTNDVRVEWRAQIERCVEHGLRVSFLNSHEHIHALPSLFDVATTLAQEFDIAHLRFPMSRVSWNSIDSLLRGVILKTLEPANRRRALGPSPNFLGLEISGRLNLPYLERTIAGLRRGRVYELMCHPGYLDVAEVSEERLLRYHDWEGELRALTSPVIRQLLADCGVQLIGYRDLDVRNRELVLRTEAT